MTCDESAIGLWSLRALAHSFFGTGMMQEVFYSLGTFFNLKERLKRESILRLMLSGPLDLLIWSLESSFSTGWGVGVQHHYPMSWECWECLGGLEGGLNNA